MGERTATDLISQLLEEELVTSTLHRAPLRFHIPAKVVGYYFSDLYPTGSIKKQLYGDQVEISPIRLLNFCIKTY